MKTSQIVLIPLIAALVAPASAQTMIIGKFMGCGLGQGILECGIVTSDGAEYYLARAEGNPAVSSNISDELFDRVDVDAWISKQVEVKADLGPHGEIINVHSIHLAQDQLDTRRQNPLDTTKVEGVIHDEGDHLILHTEISRFPLAPGAGYRLGDLAMLYKNSGGEKVSLTGYFLFSPEANGPVFVVTDLSVADDSSQPGVLDQVSGCGFPVNTREHFISYVMNGDMPATFESTNGNYLFFRSDGTMAGGGQGGESSLWEANWQFTSGEPTGQIHLTATTPPEVGGWYLDGAYNLEIFPDEGSLILNCVDFFRTDF